MRQNLQSPFIFAMLVRGGLVAPRVRRLRIYILEVLPVEAPPHELMEGVGLPPAQARGSVASADITFNLPYIFAV